MIVEKTILVTGSRNFTDFKKIHSALLNVWSEWGCPDITIVHGACPTGADYIADRFASARGWKVKRYPADWSKHGRAAGPIRNKEMVDSKPDLCLAFLNATSNGSKSCAEMARNAGIITIEVYE